MKEKQANATHERGRGKRNVLRMRAQNAAALRDGTAQPETIASQPEASTRRARRATPTSILPRRAEKACDGRTSSKRHETVAEAEKSACGCSVKGSSCTQETVQCVIL